MFEQVNTLEILKWAALVFLAGFIGFFGKYLGRVVISLFQKTREPAAGSGRAPDVQDEAAAARAQALRDEEKLRKKASKDALKERKKLGK
jgi:hypothetical protein